MRDINHKTFETFSTYGLRDYQFDRMIRLLEDKGFVERVLRVGDKLSLRPAKLTEKGVAFLKKHSYLELEYPMDKKDLKAWLQKEKLLYFNGADEDDNFDEDDLRDRPNN